MAKISPGPKSTQHTRQPRAGCLLLLSASSTDGRASFMPTHADRRRSPHVLRVLDTAKPVTACLRSSPPRQFRQGGPAPLLPAARRRDAGTRSAVKLALSVCWRREGFQASLLGNERPLVACCSVELSRAVLLLVVFEARGRRGGQDLVLELVFFLSNPPKVNTSMGSALVVSRHRLLA